MAYIGATPSVQTSTPAVDYFSGNGSTTQFTLSRNVASTYQMVVIVANVPQNPSTAYTVLGNVITFTSAPPAGSNNIWVYYTSFVSQVQGITQNPVISGTVNANSAIFSSASGTAPLTMNIAGTQTAIFDSNGNFGLGVTPSAWGSAFRSIDMYGWGSIASATDNTNIFNNAYYNGSSYIYKNNGYANRYSQSSGIHYWFTAPSGTAGGTVTFTQAMTLDNSGVLAVGTSTTSSATRLVVQGSGTGSNTLASFKDSSANTLMALIENGNLLVGTTSGSSKLTVFSASGYEAHSFYRPTSTGSNSVGEWDSDNHGTQTTTAYIRADGGLANYSTNNTNLSDERTKTDIQDSGSYLSKICAIPVRTFKYKTQTDNELNLGVIAQEVEKVAPELVDANGWGKTIPEDGIPLKAIYQTDLQYALMKCIQELSAQVTTLQSQVAALQAKVGA
jgi:Chaperone of endosialidase